MEAFETVQKVENGKVTIELPKEFHNQSVLIKVSNQANLDQAENWADLPSKKRIDILRKFAGTAKYSGVETSKYEVYEQ